MNEVPQDDRVQPFGLTSEIQPEDSSDSGGTEEDRGRYDCM